MNGISVVICCYNSAKRIGETLTHLSRQITNCDWEIILVDNSSTDNTAQIAEDIWKKYSTSASLYLVKETRPGLSNARKKGIESSKFNILLFCDDDNWLEKDYLSIGYQYFQANPEISVLGGEAIASFETNPPDWFLNNQETFALGKQADSSGDLTDTKGWVWGAGSFYKKEALISVSTQGKTSLLSDRTGTKMTSGGDVELCLLLRIMHHNIHYSNDLKLFHYMPKERFNEEKYFNLVKYNYQNVLLFNSYYQGGIDWVAATKDLAKSIILLVYFALKQIVIPNFSVKRNLAAYTGSILGFLFLFRNRKIINSNLNKELN